MTWKITAHSKKHMELPEDSRIIKEFENMEEARFFRDFLQRLIHPDMRDYWINGPYKHDR